MTQSRAIVGIEKKALKLKIPFRWQQNSSIVDIMMIVDFITFNSIYARTTFQEKIYRST